jgi:hypothetical protein
LSIFIYFIHIHPTFIHVHVYPPWYPALILLWFAIRTWVLYMFYTYILLMNVQVNLWMNVGMVPMGFSYTLILCPSPERRHPPVGHGSHPI